jgi:excisionase family DNA binding protein
MSTTDQPVLTAEAANKAAHPKGTAVLTPQELATRWGKCRQTIYNMIEDGQLHSFKVRNSRLIPLSEVIRIEQGEAA